MHPKHSLINGLQSLHCMGEVSSSHGLTNMLWVLHTCIGLDKQKNFDPTIVNLIVFLTIIFNMCFWCSKEPSQWEGSLKSQQHMFWMRYRKIIF